MTGASPGPRADDAGAFACDFSDLKFFALAAAAPGTLAFDGLVEDARADVAPDT